VFLYLKGRFENGNDIFFFTLNWITDGISIL
jgi:hypothetical protein